MKCKSCETEINPKWKHAIDTNKCPFCGAEIMEEKLKNLFITLSSTLTELSEYPDQLNDWLLSNHSYIKTDSKLLHTYLPKAVADAIDAKLIQPTVIKVQSGGEEQEVEVKKIQSDTKTDEFFKRAEAVKPNIDGFKNTSEKTQHFKNMVDQIKKTGSGSGASSNAALLIEDSGGAALDPEELADLASMNDGGSDDEIPAAVLAMAASKGSGPANHKDLMLLQRMQDNQRASRENFENGGSRGKGGFSRSG